MFRRQPLMIILFTLLALCGSLEAYDLAAVVDNQIIGSPKVVCEESEVALDILTAKPFIGNIFVKGRAKDSSCRQSFSDPDNKNGTSAYTLSLGKCGMQRLRSANPRGISFAVTVVVSFHPAGFITKNDRAFHLSCFYTEPEEIVTSSFEVSQLPAQELSDQMSLPSCQYSVHHSGTDGPPLSWANVGDSVFHVWECKGPAMGMLVKKCFVTDGDGEDHAVVDEDGCSLDLGLLSEIVYSEEGTMRAHAKSQVFKYADSNQLFFTCQIRMCQKQIDSCAGITPPKCGGHEARKKNKKKSEKEEEKHKEKTKEKLAAKVGGLLDDDDGVDWSLDEGQAAERKGINGTTVGSSSTGENSDGQGTERVTKGNGTTLLIAEKEEEEEQKEDNELTLKGRGRRALLRQLLPSGRGGQMAAEVDVASPEIMVLDREDQARIGHIRGKAPERQPALLLPQTTMAQGATTLCLARSQLALGLPLGVAIVAGIGSLLTICLGQLFVTVQRRWATEQKPRSRWALGL